LKGKPGTVNPADLTIMTRKQALNSVELVYINCDTPFIGSVYITERTPVNRLIQIMKETRVLPKEQVLQKCEYIYSFEYSWSNPIQNSAANSRRF
jgi:hypothetical protein